MRTFIAIEIPERLKQNLDRSIEMLRSDLEDSLIRWVRLESMHLTLHFLGEINQDQVRAIQELLDDVASRFSSFSLEIGGYGCFPNNRRPRIVWVGLNPVEGELLRLQSELATQLETIGFMREPRDYHPHLTLGRVHKGLSGDDLGSISRWAQEADIGAVGRFEVETIRLIRSALQPDGASYTNLHVAKLRS